MNNRRLPRRRVQRSAALANCRLRAPHELKMRDMSDKKTDLMTRGSFREAYGKLAATCAQVFDGDERRRLVESIRKGAAGGAFGKDRFGHSRLLRNMVTVNVMCDYLGPDRDMILAVLLYDLYVGGLVTADEIARDWNADTSKLVVGLQKVSSVYSKNVAAQSDNFRKLLLTFAEDIRVIIIMIVDRLVLMRAINHHPDDRAVRDVAFEVGYLYAPLAHRLGLYAIKGELEDLSLKYSNREMYTEIARKLNETKASRDAYIAEFIGPVKKRLEEEGLKFSIKGRTKSIYSIWNKMRKQHNDVKDIYDLFAIRIILDVERPREKAQCWLAFSIVTDMYQPNPARMKDWISVPKTNGYESLHTTVLGPGNKWVEVQIRTERMDMIAENGLAAHWRYKEGTTATSSLDDWMKNVRDILEAADSGPMELVKNLKMDLYNEVFVFTPKGDLYKLPMGASVLDFAFHIHSRLGCQCVGARVNGRTRKINHKLQSGDSVEIMTSSNQRPKLDWLNYVVTSKARSKIRQTLNEQKNQAAELGKEMLMRRAKNRKLDIDDALVMKVIKKRGYKSVTDFYAAIADERIDVGVVISDCEALIAASRQAALQETESASEFTFDSSRPSDDAPSSSDVLVIGNDVKGLNYKFAKCCNPIYGDRVFGFISSEGAIKIHREDCPNAANIREKYPYRIITTRWSGKAGQQFWATLRVVGQDDKGIVTNISSILNKERDTILRSISIDSHDGLFQGILVVGVVDGESLKNIVKKISTVKGVKNVTRIN